MFVFVVSSLMKFLLEFPAFVHDKGIVEDVEFEPFDEHFAHLTDSVVPVGFEALVVHGREVLVS